MGVSAPTGAKRLKLQATRDITGRYSPQLGGITKCRMTLVPAVRLVPPANVPIRGAATSGFRPPHNKTRWPRSTVTITSDYWGKPTEEC